MSVLCTHVPDLLLTLAQQAQPDLAGKPVAILDEDERILTLSPEATAAGVASTMSPARAQLTCPEILFQDCNLPTFTQTQGALLETLAEWEVPVEDANWGLAYVDLHHVATQRDDVQKLAQALGSRIRHLLGTSLQPAIGWDSGKFTAKAAAVRTLPGTMKLIDAKREVPFLRPLPVTLLPLSPKALRWLQRLGITTLGQFGNLPPTQIQTALGKPGLAARQWALGKDDRPVLDTATRRAAPEVVTLPHPTNQLALVVTAILNHLTPALQHSAATYQGLRRLTLDLHFDADDRHLALTFVAPTSAHERIESQLTHQLETLSWPGFLHHVTLAEIQMAELSPPTQMGLFDEMEAAAPNGLAPKEWLAALHNRYGPLRHRGELADPTHPAAHCRAVLNPLLNSVL